MKNLKVWDLCIVVLYITPPQPLKPSSFSITSRALSGPLCRCEIVNEEVFGSLRGWEVDGVLEAPRNATIISAGQILPN